MSDYLIYLYIFLASIGGSAVQAATGFGYGVFVMSFLPLFLPYADGLTACGLASLVSTLALAFKYRRHIKYKTLLWPIIFYSITTVLGTLFLISQPDNMLRRILGVFLVLLAVYMLFWSHRIKIRANPLTGSVAGTLGGAMNALFGMGGPPVVVYFLAATTDPLSYLATIQGYFCFGNIYSFIIRLLNGMVNGNVLLYALVACFGIPAGMWLGGLLFKHLNPKTLRIAVYVFMILMGLLFLIKG